MLYLVVGALAAYLAYQAFFGDTTDDRPTHRSRSPSRSRSRSRSLSRTNHQNAFQSHHRTYDDSQQRPAVDYTPQPKKYADTKVADTTYATLRAKAKREGDLMAQCFQQSQDAYRQGGTNRARAKELSEKAKRHALMMDKLNEKASSIVFQENNQGKESGEVDLHDLYVKEALAYSGKAINEALRRGDSELRLIVGQGTHSEGRIAKVKPAIQDDIRKRGMRVEVDPKNAGVLIVQFGSRLTR